MKKSEAPRIFRLLLQARDLEASQRFYEALLGVPGRQVGGGRVYFDCGPVILGLLDCSGVRAKDRSVPTEALYFATSAVEEFHRRARKLGCLSPELLHGNPDDPAGEVIPRMWGERSFYAKDPSGNPLCFVDDRTLFTGTPRQVDALRQAATERPGTRPRSPARRSQRRQRTRPRP